MMSINKFDEFGDPIEVTIGGYVVEDPPTSFPQLLEVPTEAAPSSVILCHPTSPYAA